MSENEVQFSASHRVPFYVGAQEHLKLHPHVRQVASSFGRIMNVKGQIEAYIAGHPEPKRGELQALHELVLQLSPTAPLWFEDGTNDEGKIVANPSIGYGSYTIRYANGTTRDFYRIGLSANKTGISVYILGLADKTYLAQTFGPILGKASVTGYCIKFKTIKDIDLEVLQSAIRYGFEI